MPQYNPDPNIPVGFIGSDTPSHQQTHNIRCHNNKCTTPNITASNAKHQVTASNTTTRIQTPQQRVQPQKRHILFFQPACHHSQEFLKLLN